MSHLECSGLEESLLQCNQRACYATSCTHFRRAGIICERKNFYSFYIAVKTLTAVCTSGSIRLGDGAELRGRVEVCYNGSWVTICSHRWAVQEATVICSQLGYSRYGICIMHAVVLMLTQVPLQYLMLTLTMNGQWAYMNCNVLVTRVHYGIVNLLHHMMEKVVLRAMMLLFIACVSYSQCTLYYITMMPTF